MVIISIPQLKVLDLPKDLFGGVSEDVIIIDTGHYYPLLRNEFHNDLEGDLTNSEWVSKTIGRPVIKVFNSIGAMSLLDKGRMEIDSERIALAVSGGNIQFLLLRQSFYLNTRIDPVGHGLIFYPANRTVSGSSPGEVIM